MALSNLEKQLMAGGVLRPISKTIADVSVHQFTSLDPLATNGCPTAANFGKGSCQILTPTYKIDRTSNSVSWTSHGSGPLADRPSAALFGVGEWIVPGIASYTSSGDNWFDGYSKLLIAAWGDSLTFGNGDGYAEQINRKTGISVYNGGIPSDTSTQIKNRFIAATDAHSTPAIIWAGRNNVASPTTIKADIAEMVAALTTTNYIILGVTNAASEPINTDNWITITTLNTQLSTLYGNRFIDIRSWLISLYNPMLPQDVIDHNNDVIPLSLRADNVHLNAAGNEQVALKIIDNLSLIGTISDFFTTNKFGVYQQRDLILNHSITLNNIAGGYRALIANTTGYSNTVFGEHSGYLNTTGYENVAIGKDALYNNLSGTQNVAVGAYSLNSITSGVSCVAIGRGALRLNLGSNNTSVGALALYNNTTGVANSALGVAAINRNISGNNLTAFGYYAGYYQADGITALTTATNSLYLGANTRGFSNSDNNTIVIGPDAIGRGTNSVTIGSSAITTTGLQGFLCLLSKEIDATASLTTKTIIKCNTYLTGIAGASLAITFPSVATNIDGAKAIIMSVNERVSVTYICAGASGGFIGAPSTILANTPITLQYDHASLSWYISN
jgi:lysophospholipase L1-like esterase